MYVGYANSPASKMSESLFISSSWHSVGFLPFFNYFVDFIRLCRINWVWRKLILKKNVFAFIMKNYCYSMCTRWNVSSVSIHERLPHSTEGYQEHRAVRISTFNIFWHFLNLGYNIVPEGETAALEKGCLISHINKWYICSRALNVGEYLKISVC